MDFLRPSVDLSKEEDKVKMCVDVLMNSEGDPMLCFNIALFIDVENDEKGYDLFDRNLQKLLALKETFQNFSSSFISGPSFKQAYDETIFLFGLYEEFCESLIDAVRDSSKIHKQIIVVLSSKIAIDKFFVMTGTLSTNKEDGKLIFGKHSKEFYA